MKRRSQLRILSSVVMLTTLVAGGLALAGQVTKFKLKDRALIANTFTTDGCYGIATMVRFAESVTQTDGPPVATPPLTSVEITYTNGCTGEFTSFFGGTNVQNVAIANDLGSATLSAVVPVSGDNGTANVLVNLTWTANGPLQEAKDHFKTTDGNTMTHEKFDVRVRNSDIGGTMTATLPVIDAPPSFNLAEFPQGGFVGTDMFGTRTVTKKNQ